MVNEMSERRKRKVKRTGEINIGEINEKGREWKQREEDMKRNRNKTQMKMKLG